MGKSIKCILVWVMAAAVLAGTITVPVYAVEYINGGRWTDQDSLEWTDNDGDRLIVGRGSVFSEIYPEITDPEYFLKEYYCYPGESDISYNSQGRLKTPYNNKMDEALPLLQEFVHSFDWINSDELTRAVMVWKRIAHHDSSNNHAYGGTHGTEHWQMIRTGLGLCEEFSAEFARLCNLVGLECVTYIPSVRHQACLIKIGGQWIAIDPTNATGFYSNMNYPVDYETEYHRYAREVENSDGYKQQMALLELQKKAEAGEITWGEYFQNVYPGKSIPEIEALIGMDLDAYAALWK